MKSAGSIRQLDPRVVSRIAAGEAISCPSNAIKELIENSIDADSTRIIIEIDRGGYDLIRITDDGCGINYNDLPIACKAHTTSKISEYSDLQKISTFGFRGEALHSISMVTHLKIITMTEKDEVASVANYEEGELNGKIGFTAANKGTIIEARSLFYNYTMRLQGINPNSEAKKITDIISKYSVIYPQISFTVRCNKKETLATYGKMTTSESVLKLLYGFDDINFFRCNFGLNNGVYIDLFLSEPNSKVKKKTNALFINGRLVKNDTLTRGIEEAYASSSGFGLGCGSSLQFSFITMTIPPNYVDVNIHPKKEKVKFLNEKEIITEICDKVKDIVTEKSKKASSSSKMSSLYNAFYKSSNQRSTNSNINPKNQTTLQSFSFDTNKNRQTNNYNDDNNNNDFQEIQDLQPAIISQADTNESFSTKNFDSNINPSTVLNSEKSTFSLDLVPNINSNFSHSHNSSRVPTLTSTTDFSPFQPGQQKKIEDLRNIGSKNQIIDAETIDDGDVIVSSLPTVSSSTMSTSPVRSSLFAAFNSKPKEPLSQIPKVDETKRKKESNEKACQSQKPSCSSKKFLFLSEDEIDDFSDNDNVKQTKSTIGSDGSSSSTQRKTQPTPLTIVKDQDRLVVNQKQKNSNSPPNTKSSQPLSTSSPPRIPQTEPAEAKPSDKSNASPNDKIKSLLSNPSLLSSSASKNKNSSSNNADRSENENANSSIDDLISNSSNIERATKVSNISSTADNDSDALKRKQNQVRISLNDLIDSRDRDQVINDLPGFLPEHQKKAIESIEKKSSLSDKESSSKQKAKPKKVVKSLHSVFDDLKYSPTKNADCNALSSSSQSLTQSRNRNRHSTSSSISNNNDDSNMKKLEDLFQNVGSNMKRKFQVVKLYSIITMRKKREETADQKLTNLFHSNKLKVVGFIGTKTVIFTAPESAEKVPIPNQAEISNSQNNNNDDDDDEIVDGIHIITRQREESRTIYIFNLFALMKDLLKHKFLELFSNLPTFNVELEIDEVTNPAQGTSANNNKAKSSTTKDKSKKSIEERFQEVMNHDNEKESRFFDDPEMKRSIKECLEEKKAMFLDYFSIFYKDGMIKTMPDVIRGYRPSFSSFPLFLQKLITDVDWEDEMSCLSSLIDQLAQLYSILPDEGNEENPKVANNLLLQFKTSVLPELSDEGYLPNSSLRDSGSFVSFPMPPNNF